MKKKMAKKLTRQPKSLFDIPSIKKELTKADFILAVRFEFHPEVYAMEVFTSSENDISKQLKKNYKSKLKALNLMKLGKIKKLYNTIKECELYKETYKPEKLASVEILRQKYAIPIYFYDLGICKWEKLI